MLDKFWKGMEWLGNQVFVTCVVFGLVGTCLGLGALGMDFFFVFVEGRVGV